MLPIEPLDGTVTRLSIVPYISACLMLTPNPNKSAVLVLERQVMNNLLFFFLLDMLTGSPTNPKHHALKAVDQANFRG